MIKKIISFSAAIALFAVSAIPALAAKPAEQACFGKDISGFAINGQTEPADFQFASGSGWGKFISGAAASPGADGNFGAGGEINAHQAGFIPDFVIPNSCN